MTDPESVRGRRKRIFQTVVVNISRGIRAVVENIVKKNCRRILISVKKAVTSIQPRSLTKILVQFDIELHAVVTGKNNVAIVVRADTRITRQIRLGIVVEEFLPNRIDLRLRNLIAGIGRASSCDLILLL